METLCFLVQQYLDIVEFEKNLSSHTVKAYRTDLSQFIAFADGKEPDRALMSEYIKHLNRHFSPRSAKRKIASVRAFYRSCILRRLTAAGAVSSGRRAVRTAVCS